MFCSRCGEEIDLAATLVGMCTACGAPVDRAPDVTAVRTAEGGRANRVSATDDLTVTRRKGNDWEPGRGC